MMSGCNTVSAVELVGNGDGAVDPAKIDPADLAVAICRPFGDPDDSGQQPIERVWLAPDTIEKHIGIAQPDETAASENDAVIVLVDVPLPGDLQGTPASELSVEITVSQLEQQKARGCPRCESDMVETFENGGCTRCGFYFDAEHLSEDRRAELDAIHDEYQSSDAT